ncbi:parathyroid hormone 2 receptor-like isoform X2 [Branchiostoma floridae]|uniref:Parathyroid hormone 2 receptor-like isoform X2 n=1 Tax=Branchiostoma floridae TaxID=7739 RepID=A0A9J7N1W2_BRAFL|nr:parathyroid hormone 2 receptor-like isoform X2 [Branchiostoma floridae]
MASTVNRSTMSATLFVGLVLATLVPVYGGKDTPVTKEEQMKVLWEERQKCKAGMEGNRPTTGGPYCNQSWDALICWPYSKPNRSVRVPCPKYVHDFNHRGYAFRECGPDGEWLVSPHTNKTYANYTECSKYLPDLPSLINPDSLFEKVTKLYTVGYSFSLASLTVALAILVYFKRLHCTRNYVHMHLFVSFILRAIFVLVKDAVLYSDDAIDVNDVDSTLPEQLGGPLNIDHGQRNTWTCKLAMSLFMYFMATNYYWVLVEGLYLHNLIFISVFSEKKFLRWFIAIGWGFPLTFVIPWVLVRAYLDNIGCWDYSEPTTGYLWIYRGPIVAAILINFLLFVNILRIVVQKLRMTAAVGADQRKRFCCCRWPRGVNWKLAKSTLVLIPLFGVHYIVFVGMPDNVGGVAYEARLYFDLFFNSFQGFFVAILYCFLNGEVRAEFQKRWERWQLGRNLSYRSTTCSPLTCSTAQNYSVSQSGHSQSNGVAMTTHSVRTVCTTNTNSKRSSQDYFMENDMNHGIDIQQSPPQNSSPKRAALNFISEITKKCRKREKRVAFNVNGVVIPEEGADDVVEEEEGEDMESQTERSALRGPEVIEMETVL